MAARIRMCHEGEPLVSPVSMAQHPRPHMQMPATDASKPITTTLGAIYSHTTVEPCNSQSENPDFLGRKRTHTYPRSGLGPCWGPKWHAKSPTDNYKQGLSNRSWGCTSAGRTTSVRG
eukprot:904205-Amphidinium_carterae.1